MGICLHNKILPSYFIWREGPGEACVREHTEKFLVGEQNATQSEHSDLYNDQLLVKNELWKRTKIDLCGQKNLQDEVFQRLRDRISQGQVSKTCRGEILDQKYTRYLRIKRSATRQFEKTSYEINDP